MGVIKMPVHPETNNFAGVEKHSKHGICLRFTSASDPDGVLETKAMFLDQYAKLELAGKLTQTMRVAKVALDTYEDEHSPSLIR
jgi:hypothetical protein